METMPLAEVLRDQHFHSTTKQLFPLISEQLLRLGVNEYDLARLINDDHCVWRRFEQTAKSSRGFGSVRDPSV
jgi:hypothetical protein